jgi:hypothetical protein
LIFKSLSSMHYCRQCIYMLKVLDSAPDKEYASMLKSSPNVKLLVARPTLHGPNHQLDTHIVQIIAAVASKHINRVQHKAACQSV